MKPVLTKQDFARRYKAGEFGNASPTWDSLKEYLESGGRHDLRFPLIHIRNRVPSGRTWYDVPREWVSTVWGEIVEGGVEKESNLYLSAMAPTEITTIQGEVQRSPRYLDLWFTTLAKPMRVALREESTHTSGIVALGVLQRFLCPRSYEWLWYLLDTYPDHIVEFSCYARNWGTVPGFNTVFWEVRRY